MPIRTLSHSRPRSKLDEALNAAPGQPMIVNDDEVTTIPPDAVRGPHPAWAVPLPQAPPTIPKREDE